MASNKRVNASQGTRQVNKWFLNDFNYKLGSTYYGQSIPKLAVKCRAIFSLSQTLILAQ